MIVVTRTTTISRSVVVSQVVVGARVLGAEVTMTEFRVGQFVEVLPVRLGASAKWDGLFNLPKILQVHYTYPKFGVQWLIVTDLNGKRVGPFDGHYPSYHFQLHQPMAQDHIFKAGEFVELLPYSDSARFPELQVGGIYEIGRTEGDGWMLYFTRDPCRGYNKRYFKLHIPMAQQIKAGDKVRCITQNYTSLLFGDEAVVAKTRMPVTNNLELLLQGDVVWRKASNFELVTKPKGKVVGYKLLKDLPDVPAGVLIKEQEDETTPFIWQYRDPSKPTIALCAFSQETIEQPSWFEPVYVKPSEDVILASGKVLAIDYATQRVHLRTGANNINTVDLLSFTTLAELAKPILTLPIHKYGEWNVQVTALKFGCVDITREELESLLKDIQP
jgi:hypothetical protein